MRAARGFVLVNALVLVAALSAVALFLLSRAEEGRARVMATGQAVQLELYLDAYEALARTLLDRDVGAQDHMGEAWARADHALPLDRGQVAGQIRDLQGQFNLNWLANPEDVAAREIFARLLAGLGVAPRVETLVLTSLAPGGAGRAGQRDRAVAEDLPGGAVLLLDQIPLPEKALARMQPYVTVLPGDSQLNVNTAPARVLAGFIPGANPAGMAALLRSRATDPFTSVDAFVEDVARVLGAEQAAAIDPDRLSVGSQWFEARINAGLEGRTASRLVVIRRLPLPAGAQVAYRLDKW